MTATTQQTSRVGERVELARYTIPAGERIIYGQRVNGTVRFLPDEPVVLADPAGGSEDGNCRPRGTVIDEDRSDVTVLKRPSEQEPPGSATTLGRQGVTGERVELARYSISAGGRVLYGQRVLGVVRVTDVPLEPGERAYLVERGLEQEGIGANAALHGLVADYLRQAAGLDAVPMAGGRL